MKYKNNFIFAILFVLVFLLPDQIFKFLNSNLSTMFETTNHKEIFWLFLFSFILSMSKSLKAVVFVSSILILIQYFQMIHFSFYQTWIEPYEIYLFFTHLNETFTTLNSRIDIFILPTILLVISIILLLTTLKISYSKTNKTNYIPIILILFVIIGPIQAYVNKSPSSFRIDSHHLIFSNTIKAYNTFFAFVLPSKLFGISNTKLDQPLKKVTHIDNHLPDDINIILILGESLRYKNMQLFGYNKETTPFLYSLKNDKNFIYKKTISASVFTYVSLSSLLNIIDKPNGLPIVTAKQSCLPKMAKQNDFMTYFISAQARDSMRYVRNSICLESLDVYKDAYNKNHDNYLDEKDIYLFDEIKDINLSNKNFIILHQFGSHSVYRDSYPKKIIKFKEGNIVNEYDNSIVYTDIILEKIITYLKNKSKKPTIILFTSDHGESLGENGIYGHGNYKIDNQVHVPTFIYSINTSIPLQKELEKIPFITHYQLSKYIAYILGYSVDDEQIFSDKKVYINGKDLTGLDGYRIYQIRKQIPDE